MRFLGILVVLAGLAQAECLGVFSEKILAGDLAPAVPLFQTLDPATPLGFAPLPGTSRVLSGHELRLIARRLALDPGEQSIPDVCIARLVQLLTREQVETALASSLAMPDAQIEVLEFSNQRLPPGRLEFRLSGLNRPSPLHPENPVIWRGRLLYDGNRSAGVWAKVRISVQRTWLVAAQDISAREAIQPQQLREASGRVFPFPASDALTAESIAGKLSRRSIRRGQRIPANALQDAPDVARGETVRVNVTEGQASVTLNAVARSGGTKGDIIVVHNPSTGRDFRAVIEDKGQVTAPPPTGN